MRLKRLRPASRIVVLLAATLVGGHEVLGQSPPRKVRRIQLDGGRLDAALRPDDQIVEIGPLGEGAQLLKRPPRELLTDAVHSGGVSVLRVEVTGISGVLTDEGTFLKTQFVGTVREIFHTGDSAEARRAFRVGRSVEFTVAGGEVAIGGVVVRSAVLTVYPYPAEYLVILDHPQHENGWSVSLSPPLRIAGDDLQPVPPQRSWLEGLRLSEVQEIAKPRRRGK